MAENSLSQQSSFDSSNQSYWVVGDAVKFVATGEDTNNRYDLFNVYVPPGVGATPHIHLKQDEGFYVVDGKMEFQLNNQTLTATAGTFVSAPKGTIHAWKNLGTKPANMLVLGIPSGLDKLIAQTSRPFSNPTAPPPSDEFLDTIVENFTKNNSVALDSIIFSSSNFSTNEDGTSVAKVTLLRPLDDRGAVSVKVKASEGTAKNSEDFSNTEITVNFADGERFKTVDIPIIDDDVIEANEKIDLKLSDPTNGAIIGLLEDTATLTIEDNDAKPDGEKGAAIAGDDDNNILTGKDSSENIAGGKGNDTVTGGGLRDLFTVALGDGIETITDFGGVGKGSSPSTDVNEEIDTLKFEGVGLTANNMLLTQNGSDLQITFEGVENTEVVLKDFALQDLDNLRIATGGATDYGNVLFDGQIGFQDSFDIFNADRQSDSVFNPNSVTFLNDLDNDTSGFERSNDVINAQGGNDLLEGLSGNDLLRGSTGNDILVGGFGSDTLIGGGGSDTFAFAPLEGIDTILDFADSEDFIGLSDGLTFSDLTITQGTGIDANNTLIAIASSNELLTTLNGVSASTITIDDFTIA